MSYDLLAVLAGLLAIVSQIADVRTTNAILNLGGYEINGLMRALQAKTGEYWGAVTLGAIVAVLGIAWATLGVQSVLVLSVPVIAFNGVVIFKNLRVIEQIKRGSGLL